MSLYESAKKAAFQVQDAHIRTKGLDWDFHKFTNVYKELLDIAHDIGEKSEDAGKPINSETDCEIIEMETYDAIESLKEEVEKAVKSTNPGTAWTTAAFNWASARGPPGAQRYDTVSESSASGASRAASAASAAAFAVEANRRAT